MINCVFSSFHFFTKTWYECIKNMLLETFKKTMPQIDKVTFLTTVYWTFIFYFFLYLDLSVTYLYKFFTNLKFKTQRMSWVYRNLQVNALKARLLSSGAWF